MARLTRTAAELISDARLRSGLEDGQFRNDANIRRYLEESGFKMFGKINGDYPSAYYLFASSTISAVSGTALYDLPADCFKPITFRVTVNGVSLTVSALDADGFEITIIPHTLEVTNFKDL